MIVRKKKRNRSLKGKARRGTTVVKEVNKLDKSPYLGSIITGSNRRDFMASQEEIYIKNHVEMFEARKQALLDMPGTDEEKAADVRKLEESEVPKEVLAKAAKEWARYMANKEVKHYKAYQKGLSSFRYRGQVFPVLTEELMMRAAQLKEIINTNQQDNEQDVHNGIDGEPGSQSEPTPELHQHNEGRVDETLRSDSGNEEVEVASGSGDHNDE